MTGEANGWAGPHAVEPWALSAAPHLRHADEWVAEALRAIVEADGVAWSSDAAVEYRASLADGADVLRAVKSRLADALALAIKHDAAVELARQTTPQAALEAFHELFSVPTSGASLDYGR